MKYFKNSSIALAFFMAACSAPKTEEKSVVINGSSSGEELYETVKKFVSLGEHRTGTPVDSLTAFWLKSELDSIGAKTEFVEFPLKQFFFEDGTLKTSIKPVELFPVWPIKEGLPLSSEAPVVDGDKVSKPTDVKGKVVFTRYRNVHGGSTPESVAQLEPFIKAGAKGVVAVTENNTGEIVALNTFENLKPWTIPVYLAAPKDTAAILAAISKRERVKAEVHGKIKETKGRDVVARIGKGNKFVVISTPISGWFTTGGERGPGIAIWLGLAKWAAANQGKFPAYTFVFTGNSGHELSILGAHKFVENAAPKPEETSLWIHLGAGVAVRNWVQKGDQWILTDSVDSKRGIYYDESVAPAFESAFSSIKARKSKGTAANKATVKPGGEGALFKEKGYTNLVSLAHTHRYHHVKSDNETATSPALLEELEQSLEKFITTQLNTK